MSNLNQKRIVVVVSGGIAAYKAAELVSRLRKLGAEVRVVMTPSAREFITPLTFESLSGHPVYADVFERPSAWEMEHISWARWADAVVVAPATANLLAKLAAGLADDAATTLLLAFQGPVWVAPAMNHAMWGNPATQHNLSVLRQRGVEVIGPEAGRLACGEEGAGRLADPAEIVAVLEKKVEHAKPAPAPAGGMGAIPAGPLKGKCVMVTAGPTREALDPIRFLSNRSTGRMGTELAAEAAARGARVILIHGPLSVPVPPGLETVPIQSARDLLSAVQAHWGEVDVAVFAAAVANYELREPAGSKIKSDADNLELVLSKTPDVAAWAGGNRRPGQVLIGFAAESEDLLAEAERKRREKGLDFVCANPIGEPGIGFEAERNRITLIGPKGHPLASPEALKSQLAGWIWDKVLERLSEGTSEPAPASPR